jgi:PAS domain S-box-containing protein
VSNLMGELIFGQVASAASPVGWTRWLFGVTALACLAPSVVAARILWRRRKKGFDRQWILLAATFALLAAALILTNLQSPGTAGILVQVLIALGGAVASVLLALQFSRDAVTGSPRQRIAELQKELASVRKAEERFRDLFDNSPDYALSVNAATGLVEECNNTLAGVIGLPKSEIVGYSVLDLYHEDSKDQMRACIQQFQQTGVIANRSLRLRRADGTPIDVALNVSAVRGPDQKILRCRSVLRDLTEVRQIQQQLRDRDEIVRSLLESTAEAILGFDMDGRCLFCNRTAVTSLGYQTADELIGRGFMEIIRAPNQELNEAESSDNIPTHWADRLHRDDRVLLRADGTSFPTEFWRRPILRDGQPHGVVATFIDITERRESARQLAQLAQNLENVVQERTRALEETLERLQARESRISSFVTQGLVGMCVTSINKEWLEANDAFVDLIGYPRDELFRMTWTELTHPDDLQRDVEHFDLLLSDQIDNYQMEKRYIRKDGSTLPALLSVSCHRGGDGKVTELFATIVDLTKVKAAELASEEAARRVLQILDLSQTGYVAISGQGVITDWNRSAAETFGWSRHEILGQNFSDTLLPLRYHEAFRRGLSRFAATGESRGGKPIEFIVRHREGREFPAEFMLSALQIGDSLEYHAFIQDITERRKAEEDLRNYARRLKQSNADLEQFAYVASHDLQEPLRAVSGFCQLLELDYGDRLNEEAHGYIAKAVAGTERMRQLIQDLLEFSRVNRQGVQFELCNLTELAGQASDLFEGSLRELQGRIEVDPLPKATVDRSQIIRLFQNLFGNAIKYRNPSAPPQIRVSVTDQVHEWKITVQDNGIGIAPEFHQRIFVIFQRLHTRDEYEGTGIGLAICQRIVLRHGGQIWVDSEPNQGSRFHFTLPKSV